MKKLLVEPGHIQLSDFEGAVKKAQEQGVKVIDVLIADDLIEDDQWGQVIAEHLGVPFVNLRKIKIPGDVLRIVPAKMAEEKGVIAFEQKKAGLKVGMLNPDDKHLIHTLEKRSNHKIIPCLITRLDFQGALASYRPSLREEFNTILEKLSDPTLSQEEQDEMTVRIVDRLIQYGYESKASDIHIEPARNRVIVRFRIDGVMHVVLEIPRDLYELILMRIKILAKMRTDEHRAAQDGKIRFDVQDEVIDVRVSVVPVTAGENVVMRLLSSKSRQFDLSDLGFSEKNFATVRQAINNPHGMILATGPTGCGKTTTLYAILKILNKRDVHIATIEDPVEYDIEGVSQIQVNPKTNLTFAKGLRAIVRQDPDIIMVGEIRDEETAGIAVNSALTGHLVLSTLHTNDAATTLPRLLDMKVEPFLVASTVNLSIAQRLVRKICEKCRASYKLDSKEKKIIEDHKDLKLILKEKGFGNLSDLYLYKGGGCKACGNTGYLGRTGIFEVLEMSEKIKNLILKRASSDNITQAARLEGMITMMEEGVDKALQGITTFEEILRVTAHSE